MDFSGKNIFIFDLDGTLVDAYGAIKESLDFVRRQYGLGPVSHASIRKKVGRGDKQFVYTFFPRRHADEALALYREHHFDALRRHARNRPFAGMLLYRLKRMGKFTAIASNRPSPYTRLVVEKTGLARHLDYIVCADDVRQHKPHPKILQTVLRRFRRSRQEAVFVGDMDVDMETARRARIDAVFITGGSSSSADVRAYTKFTVHSLEALYQAIRA